MDEESAVISAVEAVNPAVVSIVVTKDLPKFEEMGSPFGGFFFGVPTGETEKLEVGAGSGFIISPDGMVVTNKHVVADSKAEYTVITKDNQKYTAKILASDPFNDLAIVKIEAADLPIVTLADSDKIKLGQKVIAIGNALGEFQNTVTTGVVSGIGRNIVASGGSATEKLSELIQTDAAINPGNSGGPLIDLAGEVIGVNTAVSEQAQLIGFAIPINQVKKVISDVEEFGKVRRPFLGVRYRIVTESFAKQENLPVDYGALIVPGDTASEPAVVPGSAAAEAGFKSGDIILELDGVKITAENQLADILRKYNPGDRVILKILSGKTEKTASVILGEAQ
ncbi:MAG: trypsin-like peptidase domain-containing protein [Candidatus Doudnabacteria bacterium]|nr:trypsin-like peptidase domain-containing protein [Candidatus Doudnabacteria bacterium]